MKKFIVAVSIVCLAGNLFAVDISALSESDRLTYLRNSLSINIGTVTQSSAVGATYYGISTASGKSSSQTVWTPYHGENAISKAEFFRIVGEVDLAAKQEILEKNNKKNKKIANTFFGIGSGIACIGLIVELIPLFGDDYSDSVMKMVYAGAGTALGGLAIAAIGIPFESKSKLDQDLSTTFVVGLADNYNLKLYASLSK